MSRSTSAVRIALLGAFLTVALAMSATSAGAATVIHFVPESLPALETQLGKHEVHAVTFHPATAPAPGRAHVSMNDGRHFTVVYSASEQEHLIVLARATGVRYAVATVKTKPAKATHHTLRYIAGGIVIVVIVVVAAVLLVDRRRKLNEGDKGPPVPPAPSSPGDSAT
jgi:hypothetical protein